MNEQNRLTTKEFWTVHNPAFQFERHQDHAIETLLKTYIPAKQMGECLEIGSFPGPFLAVFGDLGYSLNGIDFHPKNARELPEWLKGQGFTVGQFHTVDFFEFRTTKKFDVVASFGFIEHFENYKDLILRHASLVKEDGYLVITTPNFRGVIQQWLHKTFDSQNLRLHNLHSMKPDAWAEILKGLGFEIQFKGYLGGFLFWRGQEYLGTFKRKILWFIARIIPRINKLLWFESPAFSGYCGIVAKKSGKKS